MDKIPVLLNGDFSNVVGSIEISDELKHQLVDGRVFVLSSSVLLEVHNGDKQIVGVNLTLLGM